CRRGCIVRNETRRFVVRISLLTMALGGILTVILVSLGIITWMLREWPAPMVPLFVMGSALVVIYLALGVAWMTVSKRELESGVGAGGENAEERALKR